MTDNPVPFLLCSGKEARHIYQHQKRHIKTVTKTNKASCLHGSISIQYCDLRGERSLPQYSRQILDVLLKKKLGPRSHQSLLSYRKAGWDCLEAARPACPGFRSPCFRKHKTARYLRNFEAYNLTAA